MSTWSMSSWRWREYALATVTALALCFVIAVLSISKEQYAELITHSVSNGLKESGVIMTTSGATLEGTGIKADELSLFFPQALFNLVLNDAHLRLSLPKLLILRKNLSLHATAYRGVTVGNFNNAGTEWSGNLSSRNIQLQDHPQLQAMGLSAGDLSVDIPSFEAGDSGLKGMEFTILLKNLSKPEASVLFLPANLVSPSIAPLLGGKLTIPPFSSIGLKAIGRLTDRELTFSELELASPAGSLKIIGSINGAGRAATGELKGVVKLTDKGLSEVGVFLPLLTRNAISSKTKSFRLELRGPINAQNIKFLPCSSEGCTEG